MSSDELPPVQWAIRFTASFESELLLELLLRNWNHPFADDSEYRNSLLEGAMEVLQAAQSGTQVLTEVDPEEMNFVAAVWYVEECGRQANAAENGATISTRREEWLNKVRRSIPSCFCNSSDLM